jgi:hypothetical protein
VVANATPITVEAERFVLKDGSGNVRAEMSIGIGGAATLRLLDDQARPRIELVVSKSGSSALQCYDLAGKPRVILASDEDGTSVGSPVFSLNAKDNKGGIAVWVSEQGRSCVTFYAPDGSVILELPRQGLT